MTPRQLKLAREILLRSRGYLKTPGILYSSLTGMPLYRACKQLAVSHDKYITSKWRLRRVQRFIKNEPDCDFEFTITKEGKELTVKATKRGYGYKYITWEPFRVFGDLSAIKTETVVKEIKIIRWKGADHGKQEEKNKGRR